jgi:hypothetical protein
MQRLIHSRRLGGARRPTRSLRARARVASRRRNHRHTSRAGSASPADRRTSTGGRPSMAPRAFSAGQLEAFHGRGDDDVVTSRHARQGTSPRFEEAFRHQLLERFDHRTAWRLRGLAPRHASMAAVLPHAGRPCESPPTRPERVAGLTPWDVRSSVPMKGRLAVRASRAMDSGPLESAQTGPIHQGT